MPATPKGSAIFDLVAGATGIATIGVLGLVFGQPMLFPSLGPTLILVLVAPREPSARPVNALVGHNVGIAAAVASLALTAGGRPNKRSVYLTLVQSGYAVKATLRPWGNLVVVGCALHVVGCALHVVGYAPHLAYR